MIYAPVGSLGTVLSHARTAKSRGDLVGMTTGIPRLWRWWCAWHLGPTE